MARMWHCRTHRPIADVATRHPLAAERPKGPRVASPNAPHLTHLSRCGDPLRQSEGRFRNADRADAWESPSSCSDSSPSRCLGFNLGAPDSE
eukprot:317977-Chlamydomonas_euryale.AAC.4